MGFFGGVVNVKDSPTVGAGTTPQRPTYGINGQLWINLDTPNEPAWQRYRASDATWVDIGSVDPTLPAWSLAGNTLTGGEKLGSLNDLPVVMYQNNVERLRLPESGSYDIDMTGSLRVVGTSRFTGIPTVDNITNSNFFTIVTNIANPYIRMFWSGFYDFYLRCGSSGIEISSNSTGTVLLGLRALIGSFTSGALVLNREDLSGNSRIDMIAGNIAGNESRITQANNGGNYWTYGRVQGNTRLMFAYGLVGTLAGDTVRIEFLETGGINITGTAGQGYSQLLLAVAYTPTSSADANGAIGNVCWDDDFIYVKTTAGWKRSALAAF